MFSRPSRKYLSPTKLWIETLFLSFADHITFEDHNFSILRWFWFLSSRFRSFDLMFFLISGYLFRKYVVNTTSFVLLSLVPLSVICYRHFSENISRYILFCWPERMISLTAVKVESLIPRTMIYYPQWWIANGSDDKTDIAFNFTYLNRFLK